jgi:hypothetical protein
LRKTKSIERRPEEIRQGVDSIDYPRRLSLQPAIGALLAQTIDPPSDCGRERGRAKNDPRPARHLVGRDVCQFLNTPTDVSDMGRSARRLDSATLHADL